MEENWPEKEVTEKDHAYDALEATTKGSKKLEKNITVIMRIKNIVAIKFCVASPLGHRH